MLKHGLIFERKYFRTLSDLNKIDSKLSSDLIIKSIKIKNEIVNNDPREKTFGKY